MTTKLKRKQKLVNEGQMRAIMSIFKKTLHSKTELNNEQHEQQAYIRFHHLIDQRFDYH